MKRHWFFDLDGTLARTGEDIRRAWLAALAALGCDTRRFDEVFRIGPPLEAVVRELYPDAADDLPARVVAAFRPFYDEGGFPNTVPYPGVPETLAALKVRGARLYVVTNKRTAPTRGIAAKFGWDVLFDGLWTHDTYPEKYAKPGLLARILAERGVDPDDAVMVGDTRGDVEAGRANALACVGVTYGYGTREELAGADAVVDRFADLLTVFEKGTVK